ncbi:MAG: hypothetical protein ACRDQ0_02855 [Pseudonocardia sp.]
MNIAAVLLWTVALTALGSRLTGTAREFARVAGVVLTVAAAVFAVYFRIHAMALPAAAARVVDGTSDPALHLSATEAVLFVLGATAFTAQGMLGLSMLLYGVAVAVSDRLPTALGWLGVLGGAGWLTGALLVDFAVIVPSTVVCWIWTLVLAVVVARPRP